MAWGSNVCGWTAERVIPQGALLLVTDEVGLQHLLAVLRARDDERYGAPSSMLGGDWRAGRAVDQTGGCSVTGGRGRTDLLPATDRGGEPASVACHLGAGAVFYGPTLHAGHAGEAHPA